MDGTKENEELFPIEVICAMIASRALRCVAEQANAYWHIAGKLERSTESIESPENRVRSESIEADYRERMRKCEIDIEGDMARCEIALRWANEPKFVVSLTRITQAIDDLYANSLTIPIDDLDGPDLNWPWNALYREYIDLSQTLGNYIDERSPRAEVRCSEIARELAALDPRSLTELIEIAHGMGGFSPDSARLKYDVFLKQLATTLKAAPDALRWYLLIAQMAWNQPVDRNTLKARIAPEVSPHSFETSIRRLNERYADLLQVKIEIYSEAKQKLLRLTHTLH